MFRNYLKTAIRNILREKGSTAINLAGLTLGITGSLILFLMTKHMWSYDNFHSKRDRIYRIVSESDGNNEKFTTPGVPPVFTDAFRADFAEPEEVTFTSYRSGALINIPQPDGESKKYHEEAGVVFAQPNFFKIFDRKIISGRADKGLDDPNEAIISLSLARKYFGTDDVIGSIVKYDTNEFKITAVMEDHPVNTDFPFNLMLSYITIKSSRDPVGWRSTWSDEHCYILMPENVAISGLQSRIPAFVEKHLGKDNYEHKTFMFQPLSDLHFNTDYETYSYSTVPKQMLIALALVAMILIVTACINFINLSTAEAVKRSKEVGIRKSLGSTRSQLILQFLGETTFVTVTAMLISIGLTQIALSFLNSFLELKLSMDFTTDGLLWAYVIGITIIVSLLSGLYPSLIISGYRPAQALKNQMNNRSSSGYTLRRGLVVVQFCISQFFIIGTIVLIYQTNYFNKKDLGFKKDAVIILPVPETEEPGKGAGVSKMRTLRDETMRMAGVVSASLSSTPPSSGSVSGTGFYFEGEDRSARRENQVKQIDGNYLDLYGIQIIAGTGIEDFDTARAWVVNEELTKLAGFENPQEIIGKKMYMWGRFLPVAGVVKNFHTVSLHEKIAPTVLMNRIAGYQTLSVKINPTQVEDVIASLKTKWEAAYPEHIFDYEFLDDHIREFYDADRKMSVLLGIFTSMAIFIGCLGLFGLATFMANQKTKEIGVRKALGASVESIVYLFTKEYIKLISIGFVIAAPIAWFVMGQYLNDFEYRIDLGPAIFLTGFGITLLIAVFTVGYRSFRAAIINPVNSLKYE